MGTGRADAATLTVDAKIAPERRGWPIVVRRAAAEDRDAVLAFASDTWHGYDYIPNAWPVWLEAHDGAFLVAEVGQDTDVGQGADSPAGGLLDAERNPLNVGEPIAITRVAMVSPTEAWLEGIRVDPRVRGMGVAADLQVAELQWIAAQHASVVRYATGSENEASHRLGARDGIELIARFRGWWWSPTGSTEDSHDSPSAFDPEVREQMTIQRKAVLARLAHRGLVPDRRDHAERDALWARLKDNPTFIDGQRLYEPRPWAMQELTERQFRVHFDRAHILRPTQTSTDGWAVAILVDRQLPSEDSSMRLALLCGNGAGAAALLDEFRRITEIPIRFRAAADAPMIKGHEALFAAAGYVSRPDWEMHILARQMDHSRPIPQPDPTRLVLEDPPEPIEPPRW